MINCIPNSRESFLMVAQIFEGLKDNGRISQLFSTQLVGFSLYMI